MTRTGAVLLLLGQLFVVALALLAFGIHAFDPEAFRDRIEISDTRR